MKKKSLLYRIGYRGVQLVAVGGALAVISLVAWLAHFTLGGM